MQRPLTKEFIALRVALFLRMDLDSKSMGRGWLLKG